MYSKIGETLETLYRKGISYRKGIKIISGIMELTLDEVTPDDSEEGFRDNSGIIAAYLQAYFFEGAEGLDPTCAQEVRYHSVRAWWSSLGEKTKKRLVRKYTGFIAKERLEQNIIIIEDIIKILFAEHGKFSCLGCINMRVTNPSAPEFECKIAGFKHSDLSGGLLRELRCHKYKPYKK